MSHTPGPWIVEDGQWIEPADGAFPGGGCIAHLISCTEEDQANARLIAAAPDLLEALQAVLIDLSVGTSETYVAMRHDPESVPSIQRSLAAIARAVSP